MTSDSRLHRVLHFIVELSLILIVAAVFGLLIFNAFDSRIMGIE